MSDKETARPKSPASAQRGAGLRSRAWRSRWRAWRFAWESARPRRSVFSKSRPFARWAPSRPMVGAKSVMLHPLLLFALVVVLIALVGKAFCAWMCPVPWLQRFFRPKKRSVAKGGVGHGVSAKSGAAREAAAKADAGRDASGIERRRVRCLGFLLQPWYGPFPGETVDPRRVRSPRVPN